MNGAFYDAVSPFNRDILQSTLVEGNLGIAPIRRVNCMLMLGREAGRDICGGTLSRSWQLLFALVSELF